MIVSKLAKLIILLALFVTSVSTAQACAISPFYQITSDPNKYAEKSNVIFLGKVVEIEKSTFSLQIVELDVLDVIKGNPAKKIRIVNQLENNCSIAFGEENSRYYVFGNLENNQREIIMTGFPSFVPETIAENAGMLDKLSKIKD